jgi:RNA-directed DNA polymerase
MKPLEGNMTATPRPEHVSTKQERIAELARNCPDMAFTNLAHHIDIEWRLTAHARTRKDGAVGVDGQTAEEYEVNLEANLQNLLDRAKSGTYVPPPEKQLTGHLGWMRISAVRKIIEVSGAMPRFCRS